MSWVCFHALDRRCAISLVVLSPLRPASSDCWRSKGLSGGGTAFRRKVGAFRGFDLFKGVLFFAIAQPLFPTCDCTKRNRQKFVFDVTPRFVKTLGSGL